MFASLSRTQNCWSLNCFIFVCVFFKCSFLVWKNDSKFFFFQHPTDLSFANSVCKPLAPLLCDFLAFYFKEKCQGSSYWPLRLARIAAFRKHFGGCFQLQMWGFFGILLCGLFPSGFPGSELGTLWHSRRCECAISQATWHAEIALNFLGPLKLQGLHTRKAS